MSDEKKPRDTTESTKETETEVAAKGGTASDDDLDEDRESAPDDDDDDSDDDDSGDDDSDDDDEPSAGTEKEPGEPVSDRKAADTPEESWRNTLLWAAAIFVVLSVELYIYGHDGDVQVCVGVETLTDYSLKDVPRTSENAKKHPFCAERLNLGMWSSSDERAKAALDEACGAAARIVGAEHKQKCLRLDDPWTRKVYKEQIPPWDERLYRRLLWLD